MTHNSILGYGGVGDCFIIVLKLLEEKEPYFYTHIENSPEKCQMCRELLDIYEIPSEVKQVSSIREWWNSNHHRFDKHLNMFATGKIIGERRSWHWEPCRDNGYSSPFRDEVEPKADYIVAQTNGGIGRNPRHADSRPIAEYIVDTFHDTKVVWVGTDADFVEPFGTSYSGRLSLAETMDVISRAHAFVGFNSILIYWALHNKVPSHLFMDHQGKEDQRIHADWYPYLFHVRR